MRWIQFVIRPKKRKRLIACECHLCLRISAPAQWTGPHWARSRLWRQRSTLPATRLARRRGSSANPHFSHISTVPKVLPSKSACFSKFCCISFCLISCLSVCIKKHMVATYCSSEFFFLLKKMIKKILILIVCKICQICSSSLLNCEIQTLTVYAGSLFNVTQLQSAIFILFSLCHGSN